MALPVIKPGHRTHTTLLFPRIQSVGLAGAITTPQTTTIWAGGWLGQSPRCPGTVFHRQASKSLGEALLGSFDYAFNADGSKQSVIEKNDPGQVTTIAWTYDSLNRLTSESYSGFDVSGAILSYRDTFVMDHVGNIPDS